ncbi:MAG: hypothetical protein ACM3X9_00565 [Bacillota bacterium]
MWQYAFMFVTSLQFIPALSGEAESILQAPMARAFDPASRDR